jgi:hypothetical protein
MPIREGLIKSGVDKNLQKHVFESVYGDEYSNFVEKAKKYNILIKDNVEAEAEREAALKNKTIIEETKSNARKTEYNDSSVENKKATYKNEKYYSEDNPNNQQNLLIQTEKAEGMREATEDFYKTQNAQMNNSYDTGLQEQAVEKAKAEVEQIKQETKEIQAKTAQINSNVEIAKNESNQTIAENAYKLSAQYQTAK